MVKAHMNRGLRSRLGVAEYLALARRGRTVAVRREREVIFSQGDAADSLIYVLDGLIKLSVSGRREAVVAMLGAGNFLGEECLAKDAVRKRTATALTPSTVMIVPRAAMLKLLTTKPALADHFIKHLLARNARLEDDLVDQLQSTCEQRLARTLLLLASDDPRGTPNTIGREISQATLASIVGSTRSRINHFLQRFEARGFIDRDGALIVHRSLLRNVLPKGGDRPPARARSRSRARSSP
jgi:CRP/FNR family transcriptional regulator, cyclic AMP receptor protein